MDKERLFGGNPLGVIIRLVVLSIVVGIVLSALGIRPQDLLGHVRLLVQRLYSLGFGAIESVVAYFLLGAVIVVPIWLLTRLISGLGRRDDKRQP